MKNTGRVFFIVAYIAASIVVAGHRSAFAVERVVRTISPDKLQLRIPSETLLHVLPHFAHAKKSKGQVAEAPKLEVCSFEPTVTRFEETPTIEYASFLDADSPTARAPPALI